MAHQGVEIHLCPRTRQPLVLDDGAMRTRDGVQRYAVAGGVPVLLAREPVEDEASRRRLERLNRRARELGWRAAVESEWPDVLRYVTDERRLRLLDVLPIEATHTLLEIGPGLGQFTGALARRAKHVHGLEVVPGQAEFALLRCQQDGHTNVSITCGGDDLSLPYQDNMFDGVIMNLVIEWCSSRETRCSLEEGQLKYLGEVHRVLRPGGFMFLSTKNRYALHYLFGRGDEHTGLRVGNALPRWLMNLLLRRKGSDRPAGLLHSYGWWLDTLGSLGFEEVCSYWAAPEMRCPDRYIATDTRAIRNARASAAFRQGDTKLSRMLMPLVPASMVKHVARGHCFLARKALARNAADVSAQPGARP